MVFVEHGATTSIPVVNAEKPCKSFNTTVCISSVSSGTWAIRVSAAAASLCGNRLVYIQDQQSIPASAAAQIIYLATDLLFADKTAMHRGGPGDR
jgi:hypothetical protein